MGHEEQSGQDAGHSDARGPQSRSVNVILGIVQGVMI